MSTPLPPPPAIIAPFNQSDTKENKEQSQPLIQLDHEDHEEDDARPSITKGYVGGHILIFSGDSKGFGDVLPPFRTGSPVIIPTAGDAEDHDHLDARWQGFLRGSGTFWDEELAHKYRTWSVAAWNWETHQLVVEINGERRACEIGTQNDEPSPLSGKDEDKSALSNDNDKKQDIPINRDDVMSCLAED